VIADYHKGAVGEGVIHNPQHVAVHLGSSSVRVKNAFLNFGRTCNTEIGMERTDDEGVAGGVRVGLGAQVIAPQERRQGKLIDMLSGRSVQRVI
jgi:hypothetical protein